MGRGRRASNENVCFKYEYFLGRQKLELESINGENHLPRRLLNQNL